MKAELMEAANIIAEKEREEEGLGAEPMEDVRENMFYNPVYSQVPPSAPATSQEMNF